MKTFRTFKTRGVILFKNKGYYLVSPKSRGVVISTPPPKSRGTISTPTIKGSSNKYPPKSRRVLLSTPLNPKIMGVLTLVPPPSHLEGY